MNKNFWKNKNVLVTGGAGFIGSHVVENLVAKEAKVTVLDNLSNGSEENLFCVKGKIKLIKGDIQNMRISQNACKNQDVVLNLAAKVGGIEYNRTHQGTMLYHNLLTSSVMIEAARRESVKRFLVVSSACVYPKNITIPTPESEGFFDEPEITNSGYGWAKRMAELLGKFYAQDYGIKIAIVRPYNCYGPRDHFNPDTSHVIPALIKRVFDGENPVKVWGSGKQTRAFLYVNDLAEGMIQAIEKYPVPDPVNLGTDEEISIKELIKKILDISGINAKIEFDLSKPDGSPRRNSDNSKAEEKLGFQAKTNIDQGLKETIEWYRNYQ